MIYKLQLSQLMTERQHLVKMPNLSDFQIVPSELLLEIFGYLPRRDHKSCRLVCKRFKDLIAPRILFRKLRLSLHVPDEYYYCKEHGWFVYKGEDEATICDGMPGAAQEGMSSLMPGCSFFNTGLVEGQQHDRESYVEAESKLNPFIHHITEALNSDHMRATVFAHALEFTLALPPLGWTLDAIASRQRTKWDWIDLLRECHTTLSATLFPQLLESMPDLKAIRAEARPDAVTKQWVNDILKRLCHDASTLHPNAGLDIAVSFRAISPDPRGCIRHLSGVSSLTISMDYNTYARSWDSAIRKLKLRSPALNEDWKYSFKWGRKTSFAREAVLYIGPKEKRSDQWYLPSEREIKEGLEDKHVCFWRVSWHNFWLG